MQTQITNYLRSINRDKINILTCPTHERFESIFGRINADFHAIKTAETKDWNTAYAVKPDNYYIWDFFPSHVTFDLVLSQNKFGQFQFLAPLAQRMQLPLVSIEHTTVMPWWTPNMREQLSNMSGTVNVFICENQRQVWNVKGNSTVIGHCVNTDVFKPRDYNRSGILTVANDFVNRDSVLNYKQFVRLTHQLTPTVIGDTPGLSTPQNEEEIKHSYAKHKIYLNTAHLSPIPTSLLEAMSSGCAVVSCKTCGIPEYVEHGVNGLLYSSEEEGRYFLEMLLNDPALCERLGNAARATIIEKCGVDRFIESYQNLFESVLI